MPKKRFYAILPVVKITIAMDEVLRKVAQRKALTVSDVVRRALEEYLEMERQGENNDSRNEG